VEKTPPKEAAAAAAAAAVQIQTICSRHPGESNIREEKRGNKEYTSPRSPRISKNCSFKGCGRSGMRLRCCKVQLI